MKRYLAALSNGRLLDALDAFSMDASLRDESGRERHGIREIAASFARGERPVKVEIEDLQREGDAVAVRVQVRFAASTSPREYRSVFRVRRARIQSLEISPLPVSRSGRHQTPQSL